MKSINLGKEIAGKTAADLVSEGMIVGLGTGSTALCFIKHLGERVRSGLKIKGLSSSIQSERAAINEGIPIIELEDLTSIDLTVDGADEIDPKKRMIKGGGGALFREKILASMSREMIVIVDETKLVDHLGRFPLPVEISPFAYRSTIEKIQSKGYQGHLRLKDTKSSTPYVTDNNNFIFDIILAYPCDFPERDDDLIRAIPGVITTGFFLGMAGRLIVGCMDGHVEVYD